MGGSLSFHTAFRWDQNLAGAFVFSSFLNNKSVVYSEVENSVGKQCKHNNIIYCALHGCFQHYTNKSCIDH